MTETKQWMGLHNHDRHFYSPGYGDRCGKCWYCSPETPCYCCLQAEVEALRAREQAVRDVCNVAVHVNDHPDVAVGWLEATASVLRALDGDA
jgi:hypothetical protein